MAMFTRQQAIIGVLVILAVAAVASLNRPNSDIASTTTESTPSPTATPSPPTPTTTTEGASTTEPVLTPTPTPSTTYRNGTYSADGSYATPGGMEEITLTVTIGDDKITATSLTTHGGGTTAQYQGMFKNGYSNQVVGKPVDSVSLSRISGSSLTSRGFNRALTAIKSEAKN